MDFTAKDGVRHTSWVIADADGIQFIEDAVRAEFRFFTLPTAIIAARRRRAFFNRARARARAGNFSP